MLSLTIDDGSRRRVFALSKGETLLGRAPDNDVVLESDTVSWHHARLTWDGDAVTLEDVGSSNGTFVSDVRIQREALRVPASFRIGRSIWVIVAEMPTEDLSLASGVGQDPAPPAREAAREAAATEPGRPPSGLPALAIGFLSALAEAPATRLLSTLLENAVLSGQAAGGLVLRFVSDGEPIVDAVAGECFDLSQEQLHRLRSRVEANESGILELEEPVVFAAMRSSGLGVVVMLLRGAPAADLFLDPLAQALRVAERISSAAPLPPRGSRNAAGARFSLDLLDDGFVDGSSPAVRRLHASLKGALQSELPVLLLGETGVGKEVYARAVHELGRRRDGPFRAVNAGAIPETLLESMLFGATEGAATGVKRQAGLIRDADGGTFFLDEIGEMSPALQAKLLRVIDQREVLPLGATAPVPVDVRYVAATNRQLDVEVEEGRFRKDLYFRLRGHECHLPPLRERSEDIPALVDAFLRSECSRLGRRAPGVSLRAMRCLTAYAWPGNVRELKTTVSRLACELEEGVPIRHGDLSPELRRVADGSSPGDSLDERIDRFQAPVIRQALEACDWNRSRAAERLGVSRPRLRALLKRLDIEEREGPEE